MGTDALGVCILTLAITLTLTFEPVTSLPFLHWGPRSEDGRPLEEMASDVSDRLTRMTAQMQAQDAQLTDLKAKLASLTTPAVSFTVTFSAEELRGLGDKEVLKFDKVLLNTGDGYNPNTGLFTAPEPGVYTFNVYIARHSADPNSCVEVDLYQCQTYLVVTASSCALNDNFASRRASLFLAKNDTIHVQMNSGDMLLGHLRTSFSGMKI